MNKTRSSLLPLLFAGIVGTGGCGNYSNEDIDFQNAMPAREDLAPQMQALVVGNSAEFYVSTQKNVRDINNLLDMLLGSIDQVRRFPATSRKPGERIWGPFRGEDDPNVDFRVVIRKTPATPTELNKLGFEFSYWVDVAHHVGTGSPAWGHFVEGSFIPQGGIRRGVGKVTLSFVTLRTMGIPIKDDKDGIQTLTIDYETLAVVKWKGTLVVIPVPAPGDPPPSVPPASTEAKFSYAENPTLNIVTFTFAWRGGSDLMGAQVTSSWRLSDYAGRADFTVTEGMAAGMTGTDCWGPDTIATYVHRDWDTTQSFGSPVACGFPALAPPM